MSAMKHLMDTIYDLYLGGYSMTEIIAELNIDNVLVSDAINTMEGNELKGST